MWISCNNMRKIDIAVIVFGVILLALIVTNLILFLKYQTKVEVTPIPAPRI